MNNHSVVLKKGKAISISRFHPWVFSGAIHSDIRKIKDGDLIDIFSYDNVFLGQGHFQSGGSISIRILSFSDSSIDRNFWIEKFKQAIQYRQTFNIPSAHTNAYRLIHGEGDGLPGLIIDIYNNIGVIQCHSIGMYLSAQLIGDALTEALGATIDTIFLRAKDTLPKAFASGVEDRFLMGSMRTTIISENGVLFNIDVISGQKTGFFLDQRDNRALVGKFSQGKEILNCFCYTGGFSLLALQGGAHNVDSVDISQKAVDLMENNITLNKFTGTHQGICVDVLQFLSNKDPKQYDVVIVDPPAFAKSLHKRHNAVQAYKRLNALALQKVKPGGLLFTFSCSQVVGTQLFYDTIVAAGLESGKQIRVMQSLSQGADHPINLYHPEGHYLKGIMLYVE